MEIDREFELLEIVQQHELAEAAGLASEDANDLIPTNNDGIIDTVETF